MSGPARSLQELVRRLDALVTLGVPVPVRIDGIKRLATMPPIGPTIFAKCLEVLEGKNERKRYWPLMDLLMVERAVAEQCFPDAPSTVPAHMRHAPRWLLDSPVTPAERQAEGRLGTQL